MIKKEDKYIYLCRNIDSLIEGETDIISKMSTISCELFHAFEQWNWVGFYRLVDERTLKVGPYQGTHGCLTIKVDQGVCGKCAREEKIQIENDIANIPHHIACSTEAKSEIVLPIFDNQNKLQAVFDVDSLVINDFDEIDVMYLKTIADKVF